MQHYCGNATEPAGRNYILLEQSRFFKLPFMVFSAFTEISRDCSSELVHILVFRDTLFCTVKINATKKRAKRLLTVDCCLQEDTNRDQIPKF